MPPGDAPPAQSRPTGRRPGDSGTREAILDAALRLFAERGYDGASIRAIGASAGVDPGLVRHYHRDKATLFATTLAERTAIPERLAAALHGDPATVGVRVTDTYLQLWEDPDTRPVLLALVRSATTSPQAAAMLRDALGARTRPTPESPGLVEDQAHRLALAGSHLLGVAFARHIIQLPPITALDHDSLVHHIAPTIQRYLTGNDA